MKSPIDENKDHFEKLANNLNGKLDFKFQDNTFYRKQTHQTVTIHFPYKDIDLRYQASNHHPAFIVYSGLFIPFINKYNISCKIQQKDFTDKLTFKGKKNLLKSGDGLFDKKFKIIGNNKSFLTPIIDSRVIRDVIFNQLSPKMRFEIRETSFFTKEFPTETNISDVCLWCQDWLHEENEIRELMNGMKTIGDELKHLSIL